MHKHQCVHFSVRKNKDIIFRIKMIVSKTSISFLSSQQQAEMKDGVYLIRILHKFDLIYQDQYHLITY